MMRSLIYSVFLLGAGVALASPKADFVLVNKAERKLYLLQNGMPFKEYRVSLGPQPRGHKFREHLALTLPHHFLSFFLYFSNFSFFSLYFSSIYLSPLSH